MNETEPFYLRRPGDIIFDSQELASFPDGTRVIHGEQVFTHNKARGWAPERHPRSFDRLTPSPYGETALDSYPEGFEYPHDTLNQYMWKVRDVTLTAALRHGVSGVADTLAKLDASMEKFPVGRGMRIVGQQTLDDTHLLPYDSVISYGHPDRADFALYRRTPDGWTRVYGHPAHRRGAGAIVESVGGVGVRYQWLEDVGDESADPAVNQFKIKAWEEGCAARATYSWCSTFQTVMRYLGLSDALVRELRNPAAVIRNRISVGERVSPAVAVAQPFGTMFRCVGSDGTEYWYQRRVNSSNRAGTMRVATFGPDGAKPTELGGGNYATGMTMMGYPGDKYQMGTRNLLARMQALPISAPWSFTREVPDNSIYYNHPNRRTFGNRNSERTAYVLATYTNATNTQPHPIFVHIGEWTNDGTQFANREVF